MVTPKAAQTHQFRMHTHPLLIWFTAAPQPIAVPAAFSEHCWRLSIWQTACSMLHFAALHCQSPLRILHPKPAHLQSRRYELTRNWCAAAPYFFECSRRLSDCHNDCSSQSCRAAVICVHWTEVLSPWSRKCSSAVSRFCCMRLE